MQSPSFLDLSITTPRSSPRGGDPIKSECTLSSLAPTPAHSRLAYRMPIALSLFLAGLVFLPISTLAHGVAEGDANFIQSQIGFHFWPYFYLGAKHMVTGYDHLLFLAGVVFFLFRLNDIGAYVTLFAIGHSLTLLAGVWFNIPANAYLIDAIIGLSVVYKAFENLGGFKAIGLNINTKLAVWIFGLFHGLGLATKLQALSLSDEGLLGNLVAFNIGVEAGQLLALVAIIALMNMWRYSARFQSQAVLANGLIMSCGFVLIGYQLTGFMQAWA